MIVDSHVHLWSLDSRPQPWIPAGDLLDRDFTPADLGSAAQAAGVGRVVLVQVLNRADETAEHLALDDPLVAGVVGWVDLARPGSFAGLVGVRHQALAEPDPAAWVLRHDVRAGMAQLGKLGLVCDLMLRHQHFAAAEETLRSVDGARFVLDHAGKPPIASGWGSAESGEWAAAVTSIARRPNALCKLSGLTVLAGPEWTVADLKPYAEHLLWAFGPRRLLFGSDWPVCLRAGSYQRTVDAALELVSGLSSAERAAVMGENAVAVYGL
ncbi:amidohydrolase family protein [Actinokineospora pegani]|uniref:amidohydrolase family protein n=1 Tax=Actinokineospora pegani TaxID=2654637 RepID=UPI0012EA16B3|nr:amidohydrolase family protein [Actinokineospora pegani]